MATRTILDDDVTGRAIVGKARKFRLSMTECQKDGKVKPGTKATATAVFDVSEKTVELLAAFLNSDSDEIQGARNAFLEFARSGRVVITHAASTTTPSNGNSAASNGNGAVPSDFAYDPKNVRNWAIENGLIQGTSRGRMANDVLVAYYHAHNGNTANSGGRA